MNTLMQTISNYAEEKKDDKEKQCLRLLQRFLETGSGGEEVQELSEDVLKRFLLLWVPGCAHLIPVDIALMLPRSLDNYLRAQQLSFEIQYDLWDTSVRIFKAKRALNQFLHYPVVGAEPLVIDLNQYKKYREKAEQAQQYNLTEKGYFEVVDIYNQSSAILKKVSGPPMYVKVVFDAGSIRHIIKTDMLHMEIRRKIFSSIWEIGEVWRIFPAQANQLLTIS